MEEAAAIPKKRMGMERLTFNPPYKEKKA